MKANWIATVTGGRVIAAGPEAQGAEVDSRRLVPGQLFVALAGEKADGHTFLQAAATRGAAGFLVASDRALDLDIPAGCFAVAVDDPELALGKVGAAWRNQFDMPLTAITGSCGKSTTKELLAALLGGTQGGVVAAQASFNNQIGLPLTLLKLTPTTKLAVMELGTNAPGEIQHLARMAGPDLGIVTGVGPVHLAGLGDEAGVAAEKGDLLAALPTDGTAILDLDDPWFNTLKDRVSCRLLTISLTHPVAQLKPEIKALGTEESVFGIGGREIHLPLPGRHNIRNFLFAYAAAQALGRDPELALGGLTDFSMVPGRLERVALANGALVINDAYNSNYPAARAALDVLADWPCRGRRIAILGEMLELGRASREYHYRLGENVATRAPDHLLLVGGGIMGELAAGALDAGYPLANLICLDTVTAAGEWLRKEVGGDDLVLLKASRGVKLEGVLASLDLRGGA